MHPPFGFALFFLRSVAPATAYTDKLTKKLIQPVTTMQIYWGAIPFVIIQIIMVGAIIAFPGIVSSGLDKKTVYDLDKVRIEMEASMPDSMEQQDPTAGMTDAASGDPSPADDPMKALQDSLGDKPEKKN